MCQPHLEHYNILFKMWLTHGTHLAWRYFAKISENTFFKTAVESDTNEMTLPGMILYSSQPRRQLKPIPSASYRFGPLESEWMHTTTYTFCADTKNVYDRFRELPKKINKLNKNRCLYVQGFQSDHSSVPPNLQYKWKLFKFEGKAEKKQPFIFDCPRTLSRNWALRMEPGWKR